MPYRDAGSDNRQHGKDADYGKQTQHKASHGDSVR